MYQATAKSKDNLEKIYIRLTEDLGNKGATHTIVIHQQEIRQQHSTIKIFVGPNRQKPRHPRNTMENQEVRTSLQQQLRTMYSLFRRENGLFRRENGDHHISRTTESFE